MKLTPKIVGIIGKRNEWYFYGDDLRPEEIQFSASKLLSDITAVSYTHLTLPTKA